MPDGGAVSEDVPLGAAPSLGEADPTIASLEDIYLDGTLVLVASGSEMRDPTDPLDIRKASVGPEDKIRRHGPTGPAWRAEDLYTDTAFAVRRKFAEIISGWGSDEAAGWGILSPEHDVMMPWELVKPYETTMADIGDDPRNEAHWAHFPYRRPDGTEVVTEMDKWAAKVALSLMAWMWSYRESETLREDNAADSLLVVADESFVEPLRDRGVFEYGIKRVIGDPNVGEGFPLKTRFLHEEIGADDVDDQIAWLSDAVDRLDELATDPDRTDQAEFGRWTGDERGCVVCGIRAREAALTEVEGGVYCEDCHPRECNRCDGWTHETGHGTYPLCSDCQTERGGQIREPLRDDHETEQLGFEQSLPVTDATAPDIE